LASPVDGFRGGSETFVSPSALAIRPFEIGERGGPG
jgi:hypothetical protein